MQEIRGFIDGQLSRWPLACRNFRALEDVELKSLNVGGLEVKLQYNPARIISSAARTDAASLKARPCFLCPENRPAEQMKLRFDGGEGRKYDILLNPYPIFPDHLVIAFGSHEEQAIGGRYVDLLDLAEKYQQYLFFYNGPKCGASAPDHHHFQAAGRGLMPLDADVNAMLDRLKYGEEVPELTLLTSEQDAELYHYQKFTTGIFVLTSKTVGTSAGLFGRFMDSLPIPEGDGEPRFNLFSCYAQGEYRTIIVLRTVHRSHHYFSDGADHLSMSPGCADMAGFFIAPVREDFDKLDEVLLGEMLAEVSVSKDVEASIVKRLTRTQPLLRVGVMSAPEIVFEILSDGEGPRKAVYRDGKIEYGGALHDELHFGAEQSSALFADARFVLHNVVIGKGFHWERREEQRFAGSLHIIVEDGMLTAVNVVGVEDYLLSVISSEMKESASLEFLKAHAVISRSWLAAQLRHPEPKTSHPELVSGSVDNTLIKWYDHSEHLNYDVCADDHCQRYQGLTRATGARVREAIDQTWGEVLTYRGEICDARFSKCCGGVTERYSTCWEDKDYDYLPALPDTPEHQPDARPFCDTDDREILSQVLNDYDLETVDFYEWEVTYGIDELSRLIEERSGLHIGVLRSLEPLERGASGKISKLKIVGAAGTCIIGKELEIRRILSRFHLKSSAFEISCHPESAQFITLHGRGWGHGVGLCQIGAAVMASRGYTYRQILSHYYPGAELGK